jgi:glycosyltransferase involved in cell wall biosynthesis
MKKTLMDSSAVFQKRNILMIAYSDYIVDARIKREAETLAVNGWDVSILVLAQNKRPSTQMINNVKVIELNMRKFRGQGLVGYLFSYLHFFFRALIRCSVLTVKRLVDVVHVHNMPDFLVFTAILPRLLGKKVILDIHDSMVETYGGKFGKLPWWFYGLLYLEEKASAAFAHRIICVNHVQIRPLLQRGIPEKKTIVLLNVPNHKIFNLTVRADPTADPEHLNIVYHGTLDRALGIDLALHALNSVRQDFPAVRFHIIGVGRDQDLFAALIKELNLGPNVSYQTKLIPVYDLPKILHVMHIGIVPNRKNAATRFMLPVKLLEYVSLGIPTIAPRLDAIQYYFDEKSLTYYEPGNVDDMARALRYLCGSAETRKTQAEIALKMLDRYGWPQHQHDLLNLYAGLIKKKDS